MHSPYSATPVAHDAQQIGADRSHPLPPQGGDGFGAPVGENCIRVSRDGANWERVERWLGDQCPPSFAAGAPDPCPPWGHRTPHDCAKVREGLAPTAPLLPGVRFAQPSIDTSTPARAATTAPAKNPSTEAPSGGYWEAVDMKGSDRSASRLRATTRETGPL
jgi:hypothetical protein